MPLFKFFESEPSGILFFPPIFDGAADAAHPGFTGKISISAALLRTPISFEGRIPVPASVMNGLSLLTTAGVGEFSIPSVLISGIFSRGAAFSGNFPVCQPLFSGNVGEYQAPASFIGEFCVSIDLHGDCIFKNKTSFDEDILLKYSNSRRLI